MIALFEGIHACIMVCYYCSGPLLPSKLDVHTHQMAYLMDKCLIEKHVY